jgi:23S rRNA (guanosine2251-2'-O)-methyltransferase
MVGNEVRGVDKKILKQCDVIIEIPMRGKKNSLNVSVATGIALYQIMSTIRV